MCKTQIIRNTDFTTSFYQASQLVQENQQNFLTSPASILVLLSLLFSSKGPQGNTNTQICNAITGQNQDCTPAMAQKIDERLREITRAVQEANGQHSQRVVKIANAAFVQKDFEILKSFSNAFSQDGVNTVKITDYNTEQGVNDINDWVKRSTEGMIRKLYNSPDDLSKDTLLVLLNTIFFKYGWKSNFNNFTTTRGRFQTPTKTIDLQMMSKLENMKYYKNDDAGYHLIGKDFKDTRFKFVVILPTKRLKLGAVEIAMADNFDWTVLDDREKTTNVQLTLPRFKLEHEMDLKKPLISMGISDLFSRRYADLSGIDGTKMLYVHDAKQKTVLEVNENGVKAAAVSTMTITPRSGHTIPNNVILFRVDQPFFCAIYDSNLQIPLFLARVLDPVQV